MESGKLKKGYTVNDSDFPLSHILYLANGLEVEDRSPRIVLSSLTGFDMAGLMWGQYKVKRVKNYKSR